MLSRRGINMFYRLIITLMLFYLGQNVLFAQDKIALSDDERIELTERYYTKCAELEDYLNLLASQNTPDELKDSIIVSVLSMFIDNGNAYVDFDGANYSGATVRVHSSTGSERVHLLKSYLTRLKHILGGGLSIKLVVPENILFQDIYNIDGVFFIKLFIYERIHIGTKDYTKKVRMIPVERKKVVTPCGPKYLWEVQIDKINVIECWHEK